jgi:outer membrane lipoprotein-sorting protein
MGDAFPGQQLLHLAPALLLPESPQPATILLRNTYAVKSLDDEEIRLESLCLPYAQIELVIDPKTFAVRSWKWEYQDKITRYVYDDVSFDEAIPEHVFEFDPSSSDHENEA